ncbi:ph-response regulator palc [Fusarium longipes]|uniref:pH-response regulator protein palC n=1 Tax=Fusarium longipes TaxID=694270 RepID=A0A395T8E1_9HYPO|nr:ph-response regulator palc [Fusarium longipes]
MPFPFVLPTTSSFSFSSSFSSDSHPSLPLNASTYRGVVRDALKKHKRLPPSAQISSLNTVVSSVNGYLPYLLAVDEGLSNKGTVITTLKTTPVIEWRPTLSGEVVPGRERARVKISSLEHEIAFVISTLGFSHVLASRAALQPLYSTSSEFLGAQERTNAVQTATKSLLEAASVYEYLANRGEHSRLSAANSSDALSPPCPDISQGIARALSSLALAEATLLAVLKDDPYPAIVAQDRNKNDKEWMFKAPEIPKVRAHLYARLCLAASEHAAKASSLCSTAGSGSHKINSALLKYIEDLRRTCRARACRFFGIDAELGGQVADGIGWVRAGLSELGVEPKDHSKKGLSFSKFKKGISEKREDRRVDREAAWGSDAGKLEEIRVLEMLDAKWNKVNDTMNTQLVPPINTLLSKMPSGREIHTIKPYEAPSLDRDVLEAMRAPPEQDDAYVDDLSSDDDIKGESSAPAGAFPGTAHDYSRSPSTPGNAYY